MNLERCEKNQAKAFLVWTPILVTVMNLIESHQLGRPFNTKSLPLPIGLVFYPPKKIVFFLWAIHTPFVENTPLVNYQLWFLILRIQLYLSTSQNSYSKYFFLSESGMTIVDIDGFFWRAEIYPQKQNRFISGRKSKETFGRRGNIIRNIRRNISLSFKRQKFNEIEEMKGIKKQI